MIKYHAIATRELTIRIMFQLVISLLTYKVTFSKPFTLITKLKIHRV